MTPPQNTPDTARVGSTNGSASLKRWCAWCPELGLLLETAHESRFGVRQNVRRQLYWTDKRSWQEIAAEGQWHEVEVTANFTLPNNVI